ncbi:MAG: endo-1,4-beta-xylanase [Clostridia bacterium]|nr:endo-1,4-beta-xylanase [Clostridia bacterium]
MAFDYSHRKSSRAIKLVDRNGNPISGREIHVNQKSHEFLFGAVFFDMVPYLAGKLDPEHADLCAQDFEKMKAVFNQTTMSFYLGRYEPEEGKPDFEDTMRGAKFFKENGFTVKGHPLCWHTACADWLMQYPDETILEKQLARIRRDVTAYHGVIDTWDVINEVVIMPVFDKYDNAITRICKRYGRVELVKMVFDAAYGSNPQGTFLINDFITSRDYSNLLADCFAAGAKINTIGIQSHQHQGYWGDEKLYEVLDRYSKFDMPIHFTENTFTSGHLMPPEIVDLNDYKIKEWPSLPEYEERQLRDTENMARILFASPKVEAFTIWNLQDRGAWLGAPAGWLRADGSEKPVYTRMKEIITEEWMTKNRTIVTDENGEAELSGFRGDYTLETEGSSFDVALRKNVLSETAVLTLD